MYTVELSRGEQRHELCPGTGQDRRSEKLSTRLRASRWRGEIKYEMLGKFVFHWRIFRSEWKSRKDNFSFVLIRMSTSIEVAAEPHTQFSSHQSRCQTWAEAEVCKNKYRISLNLQPRNERSMGKSFKNVEMFPKNFLPQQNFPLFSLPELTFLSNTNTKPENEPRWKKFVLFLSLSLFFSYLPTKLLTTFARLSISPTLALNQCGLEPIPEGRRAAGKL